MEGFKTMLLKPWFVFAFSFLLIGGTLILLSPNLFEGEIVYAQNMLAFSLLLGFPILFAYRSFLAKKNQQMASTDKPKKKS
jgi:hypothetical protein